MIPILDLTRQYERFQAEFEEALLASARAGKYILGPNVSAFEAEVADYLGVKHAIGCASGTDALLLGMFALRIGEPHRLTETAEPRDEVITTPFTYIATSETIVQAGAKPVFTDIDPVTFNMDIAQLESLVTPQTKAIVPVHLYGQPANMPEIMAFAKKQNLYVLEDCAQAIGSQITMPDGKDHKVGTIGDIGGFSFFPSKNLGAMGDGGLVITNDDDIAARLRMLRVHGSRVKYDHEEPGLNSRLDDLQAAILRIKLRYIDEFNAARNEKATFYNELLQGLDEYVTPPAIADGRNHVFHQYTIKLHTDNPDVRNDIQAKMLDAGVMAMIYYPIPLYEQRTHLHLNCNPSDYPVCQAVKHQVLSLPMFPELTADEQRTVVMALSEAISAQPRHVWNNEKTPVAV